MDDIMVSLEAIEPVPYPTDHSTEPQSTAMMEKKAAKRARIGTPGEVNRREYYEWSHGAVHSVLDIYEEKYSALQGGNLRGRHWQEVALHVSARVDGTKSAKTSKQCKMKIENLKRRYKMEKTHRIGNPALAGTNRWPYYDRLDSMLGFTPKCGIGGGQRDCGESLSASDPLSSQEVLKSKRACPEAAMECQGESEMPVATPMCEEREGSPDVGEGDHDEGIPLTGPGNRKDSKTDASEVNTMLNMPGTSGAKGRSKLPLRSPLTNPGMMLADSITAFAEVLAQIEQAKMEMHKDLERQRTEADLKRTQMVLDNQLEITKLVARSRKRKAQSASSSSESG